MAHIHAFCETCWIDRWTINRRAHYAVLAREPWQSCRGRRQRLSGVGGTCTGHKHAGRTCGAGGGGDRLPERTLALAGSRTLALVGRAFGSRLPASRAVMDGSSRAAAAATALGLWRCLSCTPRPSDPINPRCDRLGRNAAAPWDTRHSRARFIRRRRVRLHARVSRRMRCARRARLAGGGGVRNCVTSLHSLT